MKIIGQSHFNRQRNFLEPSITDIHLGGRNFRQNVPHENAKELSSPRLDSRRRWQRKSLLADIENQRQRNFSKLPVRKTLILFLPWWGR
jgi:hypothetical protein